MRKAMNPHALFGFAFRVAGLALAGIGAALAISTVLFVSRSVRATGEVVDYDVVQNAISFLQSDEQTGMLYYPRVAFVTHVGDRVVFRARAGRPTMEQPVGTRVSVLYEPSDAGDARVDRFMNVWGATVIVGGLGVLFLILGLIVPFGFGGSVAAQRRSASGTPPEG